jgi:hypothetical protein
MPPGRPRRIGEVNDDNDDDDDDDDDDGTEENGLAHMGLFYFS